MKRFIVGIIVSALVVYFLGAFVPYWGLMIIFFITSFLIGGTIWVAFLSHGLGLSIAWLILMLSIWKSSSSSLPEKIAQLMTVNHPVLLIVVILLIGFLLSGFSAMSGSSLRSILIRKRKRHTKALYKF